MATEAGQPKEVEITITEALAEVHLINKKIASSREVIMENISRLEHVDDPMESKGGQKVIVEREMQSFHDQGIRLVRIRNAISNANLITPVTIGSITMMVSGWLAWRREVAGQEQRILSEAASAAQNAHNQAQARPTLIRKDGQETTDPEVSKLILNINIDDVNTKARDIEEALAVLDGKLSLINATTTIKIQQ